MNSATRKDPTVKTSIKTGVTILAVTAASFMALAFFAAPAQAYDQGTCNSWFNSYEPFSEELTDVDRVKASAGSVDFGDGWHLGGSPAGDAVICWGSDGYAAIIGRLYADTPTLTHAGIDVTYYGTYGNYTTPIIGFAGQNGESTLASPSRYSYFHSIGRGHINKVRIRLYNCGAPNVNDGCYVVTTITRNNGD